MLMWIVYIKKEFLVHADHVILYDIWSYCHKITKHSHDMNKQRWNKNGRIQNTRINRWFAKAGFFSGDLLCYGYDNRRLKVNPTPP